MSRNEFYVSTDGEDANPGTAELPFHTLERARDAVRELKRKGDGRLPEGGVAVWVREGRYELREPFVLGPDDGGEAGRPVVYAACENEIPHISGGRVIEGWKTSDRLGLQGAQLWETSLPDRTWRFRDLYADGKRLQRARYPKEGILEFGVPEVEKEEFFAPGAADVIGDKLKSVTVPEGVELPSDLSGAELLSINQGGWATIRVEIERLEGDRLHLKDPLGMLTYYWKSTRLLGNGKAFVENAFALLSDPGEWFLDGGIGALYYVAAEDEGPNEKEFIAPALDQLLVVKGEPGRPVTNVIFKGLRFEHVNWRLPDFGYRPVLGCYYGTQTTPLVFDDDPRIEPAVGPVPIKAGGLLGKEKHPAYSIPSAVDWAYAERCRMEGCSVAHVGASCIGLGEGCRGNAIIGCEVSDAGGHGIHIGMPHGPMCVEDFAWKDAGDEPQDNSVEHCRVHHVGEMDWGAYGIIASYTQRTRIAHNEVAFLPYSGICAAFTWFAFPSEREEEITVERNHIHHVMLKLRDAGAIYTKDRVSTKSALRGNVIHDAGSGDTWNNGIFLDDGSGGFRLEDNVVYDVLLPIRFNRCEPGDFKWGRNYFSEAGGDNWVADKARKEIPDIPSIVWIPGGAEDPVFPGEIVKAAGPAATYRAFWMQAEKQL